MDTLVTTLMISVKQIIDGREACHYCHRVAHVTVATGADPDPEPMCWDHAREMIGATHRLGDHLWHGDAAA